MYVVDIHVISHHLCFDLLQLTVITTDRRKNQLSIKVNLIDMHPSLLVDFRLSKVSCLEFARVSPRDLQKVNHQD